MSLSDRVAVMNAGVIAQVAPPEELYHRPQSRFVAEFVGKLNTLPAQTQGGQVQIAGTALRAERTAASPDQGPCVLGFRPEMARLGAEGLPVDVVGRSFLGATVRYKVQGQGFLAIVDGTSGLSVGDHTHLMPTGGLVLPVEG